MPRTVGIHPGHLDKFDDIQQKFLITAVGRRFFDEFLCQHGKHLFIFGTTGSGKTNKGYAFVDWLKHSETQIWFDSGKQNEILPLLCMDRKVRIITPTGTDIIIEENKNSKWQKIENHPEVVQVSTPSDALSSISIGSWSESRNIIRDTITIISFRNAFSKKEKAVEWVAEFFEELAERCRASTMPNIFPASMHIDESQWAMAGKRVSGEGARTKASEIITENAFELRSAGVREILYAQGYTNIPPAARENMLFAVICHGGFVSSDENGNLSKWCVNAPQRTPHSPMQFKTWMGRFVFENGDSYPPEKPWNFRLYPKENRDRKWIQKIRVRYVGKHDIGTEEREIEEECFPELGRFSALVIKPEKQKAVLGGRYETRFQEGIDDD